MPPLLREELFGLGLVHRDIARCPAIGKAEPVKLIQHAGQGRGRKAKQSQRCKVCLADARLQTACKAFIREHRVQKNRQFWHRHRMPFRRDAGM